MTGILYPLDALYARCGVAPPVARRVTAGTMPALSARLLVHDGEMTRTLERHVGDRLLIRVLATMRRGRSYFRRVLLADTHRGRPVAVGALRLRLDLLTPRMRRRILQEREPLGRVLREVGSGVTRVPTAFFRVQPNPELMAVFGMAKPAVLYGRQTRLMTGTDRMGEVVEILAAL